MRVIGVIGGIGWQSTVSYYRYLNQEVNERLGGHHSADLILWSGDFQEMVAFQDKDDWDEVGRILCDAGRVLAGAGAELLVIASNTSHRIADLVESLAGIPVVNIVDCTARRLQMAGISTAALLGTRETMEGDYYRSRMEHNGIECLVPADGVREQIDRIIFEELVQGVVDDGSRRTLVDAVGLLADEGAEGVILGCTELSLILDEDDAVIPGFDTTRIHTAAAVDAALSHAGDGRHS